ncbi:saccharopine dehydrogenase family protein [Sinimarinibacterium thermocellulolyticum]|uniref:Saccharopine dehydrogenase NADP-binding domain-containing protein n=1 Tax=Sinimarinibacterium thermocellulolyticum TaxID=3170016 RepID=A0ABV2AAP4_9GAMM
MTDRKFHIVVFGATSFVGEILTRYLLARHGAGGEVRWAIAGRSASKLEALKSALGADATTLPVLIADAGDEAQLRQMCEQTGVVVSTVGPYALYGSPLVAACVASGTDYCDLTGEVQWIRRMILTHEAQAKATGARIVHCCGFDSIPSDLGVYFLQQAARQRFGAPCARVKMRIKAMRGGVSGGTVASLMNVLAEVKRDPALRQQLGNPFALCVGDESGRPRQPEVRLAAYDAEFDAWAGPFVMAAINTRVVHRSNQLAGYAYGRDFVYDEAITTGRGLRGRLAATGIALGLGGFLAAAIVPPTRWLLERYVVPKPGEGPSAEAQARGFFDLRLHGTTADGRSLRAKVTGDRDPGYGSTAKMLGEAAACLALDVPREQKAGGFWTPATIFGERLIDRLQAHAGLRFEILG